MITNANDSASIIPPWQPCISSPFNPYFPNLRIAMATASALHNKALNAVLKAPGWSKASTEKKFLICLDFIQLCYPTLHLPGLVSFERYSKILGQILELEEQEQEMEFPRVLFREGLVNAKQRENIELIYRSLLSSKDCLEADTVVCPLEGIETALVLRQDLTADEFLPLIAATSIARRSAEFWINAQLDPESPGHAAAKKSRRGWFGRALRDLGGFVGGALVGGLVAGPLGATAAGTLVGTAASGD